MTNRLDEYTFFCFLLAVFVCLYTIISNRKFLQTVPFGSSNYWSIKNFLFCAGVLSLCLGFFAIGENNDERKISASARKPDVIFLIDFSASMRVVDHKRKSRINYAVDYIVNELSNIEADRFGLYLFSDKEYQLIPLTRDLNFFKDQLISIQNNVVPDGGADLEQILLEVSKKFSKNKSLLFVIASDFENINLKKNQLEKIQESFNLIAWPLGSPAGGKIPLKRYDKYSARKFLRLNGKHVYSRSNRESLKYFNNSIGKNVEFVKKINMLIANIGLSVNEDDGWVNSGTRTFGNIFVFVGLIFLGMSRILVFQKKHYKFIFALFLVTDVIASDVEKKVINGDGEKYDFLTFAEERMGDERYSEARELYQEQGIKLNDLEKVNLGSLHFLNNDHEGGMSIYIKYLQKNNSGARNYHEVRRNLLYFLSQDTGGSGNESSSEQNPQKEKGDKGRGDGGKMKPSSSNNKSDSNNLSDEQIEKKLNADDLVNQGEYINKKMKVNRDIKRGEIRW